MTVCLRNRVSLDSYGRCFHIETAQYGALHVSHPPCLNRLSLLPLLPLLPLMRHLLGGWDLWEVPAAHLDDGA